jgi:FtsP/CotA-like multicopper oxidase with cupredoxin domain
MTTTLPETADLTSRPALRLIPFVDALHRPSVLRPGPEGRLRVRMMATTARLHRDLPPTPVWAYEGQLPGPTIETRRGQAVQVEWVNDLHGPYPVTEILAGSLQQNGPGRNGRRPDPLVQALTPWTVVHVHGARVPGGSDGLTENGLLPGESAIGRYPNDQAAAMLWYHDHAMGITRLNVQAGLAGMWFVRDDAENALGLPSGEHEVPLMIADRNLDEKLPGVLDGGLLHKVEEDTREFFGPYTTVNGTIWPYLDVEARAYRLRVVNASNARAYRLVLLDEDGRDVSHVVRQIGSDGGLLGSPVALPPDGLVLASSERADLVVDFGALRGRTLRWVNTATAPFRGEPLPPGTRPGDPDRAGRLPAPDVMQFRVADGAGGSPTLPSALSSTLSDVRPLTQNDIPKGDHQQRLVALVERGGELQLCETVPQGTMAPPVRMPSRVPGGNKLVGVVLPIQEQHQPVKYHTIVATRFDDAMNWRVRHGHWEVWKIINLTEDTHPFHVHLVQFQVLRRDDWQVEGWEAERGAATKPLRWTGPGVIDANELGMKDTIRVNPGEMVTIAARFEGGTGRYMYHCHILEHGDHDMMRGFVVAPDAVLDLMRMPGMEDDMHPMKGMSGPAGRTTCC